VKNRHFGGVAPVSHPGRDGEAERFQHQRRRLPHQPVAKKTDAPFLGPNDPYPAPFPVGLGRLIGRHVAMKPQYVHDDVFGHHRIAACRLDLAEPGLRQLRVTGELLDARRAGEHGLQLRECRQTVEIRTHEGEIFNVRGVPRLRPDANFEIGELLRERVAPGRRGADDFVEIDDEQRHVPS